MNAFITKNKFLLVLTALVICLSTAYGLTVKLDPTVNAATQDTSASDYSWATMSQAAAQYLGQTLSPDGNHGKDVNTPDPHTGFAGAFLGYMTPNSTDSRFTVGSLESANTVKYSYDTLDKLSDSFVSGGTDWSNSALVYAGYGYALTESGIDEPVIIGQTNGDKRNIIGPIVLIIFLLCMALPQFFELVLTFLSVANPFKLFLGQDSVLLSITPGIAPGEGFNNQNGTIAPIMGKALETLSNTVTGLYNTLYNLSFLTVIPIMIAIALFSWLVLRQSTGSVFKKLIIRVVFVGLGVPLMLACYTAAIDSVKDFTINTSTGTPITVIASTFCDYGSWILGHDDSSVVGMALPSGVDLNVDMTNVQKWNYNNKTSTNDRKLVSIINSAATEGLLSDHDVLSSTMSADDIASDSKNLVHSVKGNASPEKVSAVITLLQRYTKGEYITAGNYATKINNKLNQQGNMFRQRYMVGFNLSNNWKDFDPDKAVAFKYEANDGTAFTVDISEENAKSFAESRLLQNSNVISGVFNLFHQVIPDGSFKPGSYTGYASKNSLKAAFPPFSSMAIYNLLSSTFSDSAITVYSTTATTTNQVQLAHYAVSIAGKGYLEYAYVVDACAIMACLMVLGYFYGFAMLFGCFRGLIQMFPKVLTGMIGSLRGIAGAVALTAALIVEIIGTCIMYALGSLVVGSIYDLIEIPIAKLLISFVNLPAEAAALITVVSSCIVILKLTQLLVHYRTAVVKATTESATSFINSFMDTHVVAPNLEGSVSGSDIAGAALGTAMVLSSTPSGSKLVDRATEGLGDKLGEMDGGKVASATMTGLTRTGDHGEKYTSADAKQTATSAPGGTYIDKSESSTPKTNDAKAADYVASNEDDFENEIGYAGTARTSHSTPASAAGASPEYDQDDKVIKGNKLVGDSNNLENSGPDITGTVMSGDGTREEYQNGKLVAAYDANGNNVVDNSTEEITGTKTTDITSTGGGEISRSRATTSGSTTDSSMNKFVMTDASGNSQDVQIVNAKTGQAYTQADKDAGANYDVIDSSGKSVYPNVQGGMNANTLAMQNGEPTVMVGPGSNGTSSYGGGGVYQLSAPTSEVASTTGVGSAASQITQSVTQNTTQNITQTKNGESASVVIDRGSSGTTPNVNVHVAGNNGSGSMPSQTVIQQDFVQNITQQGGSTGHIPLVSSGGGNTVVNNTTYNTQHMQNVTENTVNHAQTSNNSNINVTGGNAGSERLGLGSRKLSDHTGRHA